MERYEIIWLNDLIAESGGHRAGARERLTAEEARAEVDAGRARLAPGVTLPAPGIEPEKA